jgi:phospholipid/cholesterol/gamma-HCH transport system ATP-binding protein
MTPMQDSPTTHAIIHPPPLVSLENIHLGFRDREILSGVNLQILPGERLVVLGRSGGGKSTLLRVILGLLSPTTGTVRIHGKDLAHMTGPELNQIRQRIGMVYQSSALISSLSLEENLSLPLEELTSLPPKKIHAICEEKLALVGLAGHAAKMPGELSGGMRKRAGLARALVMNPELLLLDEPGAGLDPVISAVIDELLLRLSEQLHVTCVVVTHELPSAFKLATRIAMLDEGRIRLSDSPLAFRRSRDPVIAEFLQSIHAPPVPDAITTP